MKPTYSTPLFTTVFAHDEHHQLAVGYIIFCMLLGNLMPLLTNFYKILHPCLNS
jgi:hypothetical protein